MRETACLDGLLDNLDGLELRPTLDFVRSCARVHGIDATVGLLVAAQREVGRRWQQDEWSVAQEHAASAIVDAALAQLHLWADQHRAAEAPHLALVCAEGEWHVTPARMAALRFLVRGWRVTFLGASTPSDHLARTLAQVRPDVVGISCTLPVNLPGARRVVDAVHGLGLPVVAGGAALGPDGHRARAIGADAGGGDLEDLEPAARGWLDRWGRPTGGASTPHTDVARLQEAGTAVVGAALADLVAATGMAPGPARDRTREDLAWILRFLAVAMDVDDPRVLLDMLDWLQDLLIVRGVPAQALVAGLDTLERHLPGDLVDARRLLGEGRARLASRIGEQAHAVSPSL